MGPNYWRHPANGLQKCSEKTRESCTDHDDCCAVTACTYCLELETYGDPIQHGVADQSANHWIGTVAGYSFDMYWERVYDVCYLVVIFDGEEVYRKTCDEGQSCRDSTDSAEVTVGYPPESATLRWIKHEPLALPHIDDPDTGCKTWFCGECDCSCECLCVIIRDPYGDEVDRGEICTAAGYPCQAPLWEGTVGDYVLSLALARDSYGDCVIIATVNGSETGTFAVTGCKDMFATIELGDGNTADVSCKICDCIEPFPCCPGIDYPSTIPLTVISMNSECVCIDGQIVSMVLDSEISGRAYYNAIWAMPCVLNGDPTKQRYHRFQMNCGGGDLFPTLLVAFMELTAGAPAPTDINDVRWGGNYVWEKTEGQCDPFYFRFKSSGGAGSAGNTTVWGNCGESSMDTPWIEFEATL